MKMDFNSIGNIAMKKTIINISLLSALSLTTTASFAVNDVDFSSPYMNAKGTPLVNLPENGNKAKVNQETARYWNLAKNSEQRASYDELTTVKVAEGIWTFGSPSLVNMQAIEAPKGLIIFDTGDNAKDAEEFYTMLRKETDKPIAAIVYSHEHYTFGTRYLLEQEAKRGNKDIKIIGHPNTNGSIAKNGGLSSIHPETSGVLMARSIEQFNFYLPNTGDNAGFKNTVHVDATGFIPVNLSPTHDGQKINIAGLDMIFYIEGIGTDTSNQLMVYVPSKKVLLNNVMWGWFPNIYSARGGRYRNPNEWAAAVTKIEELNPEILLSTHSTTVVGKDKIKARLDYYRDGLAYVLDQSLKHIAMGQGPDELRYSVKLPKYLADSPLLVQNYGEISLMGPRIFTALFGQFDRDAAHLNKLHPKDEAMRMVKAMGGEEKTYAVAKEAFNNGDYLWSAQVADYLVETNPTKANKDLKADALEQMGYRTTSTNSRSFYLAQAADLRGEVSIITNVPSNPESVVANIADFVNYYRIRINPERSGNTQATMQFDFGGDNVFGLEINRAVVKYLDNKKIKNAKADVTMQMKPEVWAEIYNNTATLDNLLKSGKIKITQGDEAKAVQLMGLFDPMYDWQNDKGLQYLQKLSSK
ncbi:alkyl sulfatase dimerization domain-containing protein [Shewanella sp.]|uniref:alkyl sulfatase dimerization domain-containing protein n=1 Tax=Shewanella sp. TaxID=50422 RepID=UPI003A8C1CBF